MNWELAIANDKVNAVNGRGFLEILRPCHSHHMRADLSMQPNFL